MAAAVPPSVRPAGRGDGLLAQILVCLGAGRGVEDLPGRDGQDLVLGWLGEPDRRERAAVGWVGAVVAAVPAGRLGYPEQPVGEAGCDVARSLPAGVRASSLPPAASRRRPRRGVEP